VIYPEQSRVKALMGSPGHGKDMLLCQAAKPEVSVWVRKTIAHGGHRSRVRAEDPIFAAQ
jgi:hypothetical protein